MKKILQKLCCFKFQVGVIMATIKLKIDPIYDNDSDKEDNQEEEYMEATFGSNDFSDDTSAQDPDRFTERIQFGLYDEKCVDLEYDDQSEAKAPTTILLKIVPCEHSENGNEWQSEAGISDSDSVMVERELTKNGPLHINHKLSLYSCDNYTFENSVEDNASNSSNGSQFSEMSFASFEETSTNILEVLSDDNETSRTIMLQVEPVLEEAAQSIGDVNEEEDEERENNSADLHVINSSADHRIANMTSVFEQIKRLDRHSDTCRFDDMNLVHEIKKGFKSIFEFVCSSCGHLARVESSPKIDASLGINQAVVLGIRAVGLGKAHIDEFFAHIDVPTMGSTLYNSLNKVQQKDWWRLAKESTSEALAAEIKLAIASGMIDSSGNARMSVSVDGSWGKRSLGKNMSSLSGCAALIGMRTRKIIYFDVRNKYCHVCKLAEVNKIPVREHECNKNYSGPSTGMEADIIIAGFVECETRGARFDKFIADGDSNTYKMIQDMRIYKDPDMFVDKFDCTNHLKKNHGKKWRALQGAKEYPKEFRDLLTDAKCSDICKGVEMAAKHWRSSDIDLTDKIHHLENDIMNAVDHYFGSHSKCATYFCKKQDEPVEREDLQILQNCGLYDEILDASQHYFANNAKSLLANFTTNDNESFNNHICKRTNGKRINNYLGGTYKASVAEAVVHYNSGYKSGSSYQNYKVGASNSSINKLESNRKRKCASNLLKKKINPKKRKIAEPALLRNKSYGPNCQRPDLQPDSYERAKTRFIEKLKVRQSQRDEVELNTRGQNIIPYWFEIRRDILNSSYFGRIVNNRNKASFKNLLDEIIYKRTELGHNAENKHQRVQQTKGLNVFESEYNKFPVKKRGIFIDSELYFLGASPFGTYGDSCLVFIKCPLKEFNKSLAEALPKLQLWKKVEDRFVINKKSDWYIEVQGQLHITQLKQALLMIWLGKEYKIITIPKDDVFFATEMKEKLTYFFNNVMLKELVDPRKPRSMELRKYCDEKKEFI